MTFAGPERQGPSDHAFLRWGGALAAVLAIHLVAIWLATGWHPIATSPAQQPQAVLVDLPPTPPQEATPNIPAEQSKLDPDTDRSEKSPDKEKQEPPKAADEKPPLASNTPPASAIKLPEAPNLDWATEVLALPSQPQTPGKASPASATAWQHALAAHINRFQRYRFGATAGAATVIFTIDRAGRVLSASIKESSGDPAVDREAIANIRRASPVPAPPSGLGGETLSIVQSIRLNR